MGFRGFLRDIVATAKVEAKLQIKTAKKELDRPENSI